ncbi:MAG: PEP-CTERM sorting domain-containing protein [Pirellulales bacterium]
MSRKIALALCMSLALGQSAVFAAGPNTLIMNEANAVSGGDYLGGGRFDPVLGRVQGNGQNWFEFVVAGTDPGKKTVDLRGWTIEWSFNKTDGTSSGSGTITFSNDALWSAVPQGAMYTVNEWQEAWYLTNTPDFDSGNPDGDPVAGGGGMQREGGINGFGTLKGDPYNAGADTKLNFATNTVWNPNAVGGADWNFNVYAGQKTPGNQFQYFGFTGTVTEDGVTSTVGVDDAAGLFAVNNDNWQYTIKDAGGNVVQGPIGEAVGGWAGGGVNSQELIKLESFTAAQNPTVASYLGITIANYRDGSSSTYAEPNQWNNYTDVQSLSPLRSWFSSILPGDANLDGSVSIGDFGVLQANYGKAVNTLTTGLTGWTSGDFNGDGSISIGDFGLLQANYGTSSPLPLVAGITAVPEPSSIVLLGLGALTGLLVLGRRHRHSQKERC